MTTVMFVGMSFCLPLAHFQEWQAKKKVETAKRQQRAAAASANPNSLRAPLLDPVGETVAYDGLGNVAPLPWRKSLKSAAEAELRRAALLSVPTAFDLVATVLMNVGLLSVTASVYQMMRGAEMLFAALFAVLFLRRRLNRWHLGGIGCCVAGIGLVGAASVLSGEGSQTHAVSTRDMLLGMALIIGSQAVQAAQLTFEDHFMSDAG
jgi:drug/metabolite transporter (DMT)-like permease